MQQKTLSTKKSALETLEEKEANLTKSIEDSKKQLDATQAKKSAIETQIKDSAAKKVSLEQQIAKE